MSAKFRPMTTVIFLILFLGVSNLLGQEKDSAQIHFKWQNPVQIRNSELAIDFSQKVEFKLEKNLFFTAKGLEISPSEQSARLVSKKIMVPIAAPEPFLTVAAVWKSEASDKGDIKISLRGSRDGNTWGEWQDIHVDDHAGRRRNELFGSLLFLEKETRYIQYRVTLAKSDPKVAPTLKNIRFVFSSPGKTPKDVLDKIKRQTKEKREKKSQVQTTYPKPPITSRTAWGCPQGQSSPSWPPQYTTVSHLIVHHTATSNISNNWPAVVRSIWNYHTFTLGWGDIGYNYLIDPNGVTYEGRAGGNNAIGAHFSCANSSTMGVGMIGTFTTVSPTTSALANLKELLAWKSDDSTIDPLGTTYHNPTQLTLFNISGHRDANPSPAPGACPSGTVCPGDNLYGQLPTIRIDVDDLLNTPRPFATLPYTTGFESGSFDQFWTTSSSTATGRFRVLQHEFAHSGNFLLTMDNNPPGNFNLNEANLHLDLSGNTNVDLSFWWVDAEDESHSQDGVYFSDDGGTNFTKVYSLTNGILGWQQVTLDVDQLAASIGLTLSSTFVVKFQQYDDGRIPFDGMAFDDISVASPAVAKVRETLDFVLEANYPNPFNPKTTIRYKIANDAPVSLRIYNLKGQLIRTLLEREQPAGHYAVQWDGTNDQGTAVSSGFYFYELASGAFREVRRMTLLK